MCTKKLCTSLTNLERLYSPIKRLISTTTELTMQRVTLPKYYDNGAVKLVVRQYKEQHFEEIFKMFENSLKNSTGMYKCIR